MGRALVSQTSAAALADGLSLRLLGPDRPILSVESIDESRAGSLCFAKTEARLGNLAAEAVVILPEAESALAWLSETGRTGLVAQNPRLQFACALDWLEQEIAFVWASQPAQVHATARIGRNVVLENGVKVGAGTIIHHNVVVGREVSIGNNCVIKSGAVIGEEGFGFERRPNGEAQRLLHLGGVVIEDGVEIGSLTTVCRATLGETTLKRGAKIDDHVHIAHNVVVGEDAFVIACAEISGGVQIGPQAWISPNVSIRNQLKIGAHATVGIGAVVVKSVPDDQVVAGNPAGPLTKALVRSGPSRRED